MTPTPLEVVDGVIKLRPMDAPEKLGYTSKHFNDEAKEHGWVKEVLGRAVYYHIPVDYYEERQRIKELNRRKVSSPEQTLPQSDITLAEVLERQRKLEEQVAQYNREIEARNSALVKYKEQEKSIETLSHQVTAQQTTIAALQNQLESLAKKLAKPWWKLW